LDSTNGIKGDWLKLLSSVASCELPEGYKTISMLAKEYNLTIRQIRSAIHKAVEKGEVDKMKVNIDGSITCAYKIKNPPK
jgi:ribonuclease I